MDCISKENYRPDANDSKEKPYSGIIIIRLRQMYAYKEGKDLRDFGQKNKLTGLIRFLEEYKDINTHRLIQSQSIEKLAELEERAKRSNLPPVRSLSAYWKLDCRNIWDKADELIKRLNELPEVELAYKEFTASDPVVNAADDTYSASQIYLDAAPAGINARWAWLQPNGDGTGIGFVDLEQGWILNHEDLIGKAPTLIYNDNMNGVGTYVGNHGTAVMGEVYGNDNAIGVIGIAPNINSAKATSHYNAGLGTNGHVADAIVAAIPIMATGDVLLLEIQKNYYPTETDQADFDAIRLAVASGIVVIEAGGNGDHDLDPWVDATGSFRLNRTSPDFQDSGAIMVGSSVSAVAAGAHERYVSCGLGCGSNYGSRIDCYAWGENIVSCGYGDLEGTSNTNNYTSFFGGTSGASPMITGAAIIVQGIYKAANGTVLSPLQMRNLLSNPATGTPQGPVVAGNIGVMPDLQAIIQNTLGLVPDVYLRDAAGDDGAVPSAGAISTSPDIIVRLDAVADSTLAFGEGSGTENSETEGFSVKFGQDNFIYARMKNRGTSAANGTTVTVYWSEVSTLVTPDMWHFIGTSSPVNVPVGDTLVVTNAIVWHSADIPAEGHYCFIGILNNPQDPAPPMPALTDWDGFTAIIRNQNNVTWRNFNVINVSADPSDPAVYELPFLIAGAPDDIRYFDFEIIKAFPEDINVSLELPILLHGFFVANNQQENHEIDRNKGMARISLTKLKSQSFCQTLLTKGVRHRCKFYVEHTKTLGRGTHYLAIRQMYKGFEVGRVTWAFKPAKKIIG